MADIAPHAESLRAGDRVLVGSQILEVSDEFARTLESGDRVVGVAANRALRRIPRDVVQMVEKCIDRSVTAFADLQSVTDAAISDFFDRAALFLQDDDIITEITSANEKDVQSALARRRSTTRLVLDESMRLSMVEALLMWRDLPIGRESVIDVTEHQGWSVEHVRSPLGVVAFVFEGRPNVFADATGVLRTGNTVVFRIGSDALGTARALMELVIRPALVASGLPPHAVQLVESAEHAAGWALFSDARVSLAVARGSGAAVEELGALARSAGIPVSLHGTGGAWMLVGEVDPERLAECVTYSLDRKVCNTLNTVCVLRSRAEIQVPIIVGAAEKAALRRGVHPRVHCVNGAEAFAPTKGEIVVHRVDGQRDEPQISVDEASMLGHEFEWEVNPEFAIVIVDSMEESVRLFNEHSPHFVLSVLSSNENDHSLAWARADSPFVGDGFTRWVDGQFALSRPELGLSNWQSGRLFGRSAILSGDSVFTVRYRAHQSDVGLHR